MTTFTSIVKSAIGKKVRMFVMIAENPPVEMTGYLKELNGEYIHINDPLEPSDIYINMNVSSIAIIDVMRNPNQKREACL